MMILGTALAAIAVCMLIGALLHTTYFARMKKSIRPYGQLVDVYDGRMHVYKLGRGDVTIILLPGMGVGLPSADFGPVMRRLSDRYTVVCIEYFGVGFSSQTQRARTSDNYVNEVRTALKGAGVEAPYVLMPHSISSVFSEYFASTHPDEVQAIISLDGTSTAYIGNDMPGFVRLLLGVATFQQAVGFTSILAHIVTNRKKLLAAGYTEKEVSDLLTFAGFSVNNNTLDQIARSIQFIRDTHELNYPVSVPYFKVISSKTYETRNNQITITPQEYQEQHLARIGDQAQHAILDGTHFIYLNNTDRIADITDSFLAEQHH